LLVAKKVAIGDGGYSGHPEVVSSPNPLDDYDVKLFKSRALKRQEKFNGHIKTFRSLEVASVTALAGLKVFLRQSVLFANTKLRQTSLCMIF